MTFSKVGDWTKSKRILGASARQIRAVLPIVVRQEGEFYRKKVVKGFRTQAPGGRKFKPPSETTLKIRRFLGFGGTKALIVRGDLRNSVKVHTVGTETVFVGVLKGARGRRGQNLVNVARVQEFGAGPIVIRMTDRMRRFLGAAGVLGGGGSGGGGGAGVIVVRIPARPFMRPVFEKFMTGNRAKRRIAWRVSRLLRGNFGTPGGGAPNLVG